MQSNAAFLLLGSALLVSEFLAQEVPGQGLFPLFNIFNMNHQSPASVLPPKRRKGRPPNQKLKACCATLQQADAECKQRFCDFSALSSNTVSTTRSVKNGFNLLRRICRCSSTWQLARRVDPQLGKCGTAPRQGPIIDRVAGRRVSKRDAWRIARPRKACPPTTSSILPACRTSTRFATALSTISRTIQISRDSSDEHSTRHA